MTQKIINIGTSPNKGDGDPLRTAFSKINDNFTELYATDADTRYHLGDDEQFVNIELDGEGVPTGGVTIQSGFNTAMPIYIKGGNALQDGVGGNVVIEAGAPPIAAGLIQGGGPYAGTVGDIELSANQTTIDSLGNTWAFRNDGVLELPEGGDIVDSNGDSVLGGSNTGQWAFNGDTAYNSTGNGLYIQPSQGVNDGSIYLPTDGEGDVSILNRAGGGVGLGAGDHIWYFTAAGKLQLPVGADIVASDGVTSVLGGGGTPSSIENGGGILSINGSLVQIMPPGNQNITIQPGNNSSPITLRGKFLTVVEYNSTWDPAEDPPLALGTNTNAQLTLNQNGINFSNTRSGTDNDYDYNWMFSTDGNLTLPGGSTLSDASGQPNLTSVHNFKITTDSTTNFQGPYNWEFGEDGTFTLPVSTSGNSKVYNTGEGGFEFATNTSTWTFGTDGTTTFPNNELKTSVDNDLSIVTEYSPPVPPTTIEIIGADFVAVNLTYTKDGANSVWYPPGYNAVSDPYIEFTGGQYGIFVPGFGQALYVNTGTLNVPLVQWNTNPPLGSVAPAGVYTYPGTYTHTWTFGTDGDLTVPGYINGAPDRDLRIKSFGEGSGVRLQARLLNEARKTQLEVYTDSVNISTNESSTNPNMNDRFLWQFKNDGTTAFPDNKIKTSIDNDLSIVTEYYYQPYWAQTLTGVAYDYGLSVDTDSNNNIYVGGVVSSNNFYLVKFDPSGALIWQKSLVGSIESALGIAIDNSGNIYVTGYTLEGAADLLLVKFNTSGNIVWQRSLSGLNAEFGQAVTTDTSGNIYVAGWTLSEGEGSYDFLLAKFDTDGNLVWQRLLGGVGNDTAYSVATDSMNNVYVCGSTYSQGEGDLDLLLAKFDSSGNIVWQRLLGGVGNDTGRAVTTDSNDNIYVSGFTTSQGAGNIDLLLAKFDSSGNIVWQRLLGGASDDYGWSVTTDNNDNIYVCGEGGSTIPNFNAIIVKYSPTGSVIWQRGFGRTNTVYDGVYGIAIDSNGDIVITGEDDDPTTGGDVLIVKLPNDGSGTGTHGIFDYYATTLTESTGTLTAATGTLTAATATLTAATATLTATTGSLASSNFVNLPGILHTGTKSWIFGADGRTILPAADAPIHSYGVAGDKAGMVAFDGDYIYYCKSDYVDNTTDIWVRVVWTDTNW